MRPKPAISTHRRVVRQADSSLEEIHLWARADEPRTAMAALHRAVSDELAQRKADPQFSGVVRLWLVVRSGGERPREGFATRDLSAPDGRLVRLHYALSPSPPFDPP